MIPRNHRFILPTFLIIVGLAPLTNAQKAELVVRVGHAQAVRAMTFSADARLLASVGNDNSVVVWNVRTGHELRTLKGHNSPVTAVAFSPDGKLLATVSHTEYLVKLWDIETAAELWSSGVQSTASTGFFNPRHTISFSPDGKYLAVGKSRADEVPRIEIEHEPPLFVPPPMPRLHSESQDEYEQRLQKHRALVKLQQEQEDKARMDREKAKALMYAIDIWSVSDGKKQKELVGHTKSVRFVTFSVDGKHLLTMGDDNAIKRWTLDSDQALSTFQASDGSIKNWAISKGGRLIAYALEGKRTDQKKESDEVSIVDLTAGVKLQTLRIENVESIAFSPDDKSLLNISQERVEYWNIEKANITQSLVTFEQEWLAEREARLAEERRSKELRDKGIPEADPVIVLPASYAPSISIFSLQGDLLAISSQRTITIWDWDAKKLKSKLEGTVPEIQDMIISPNGKALAIRSDDWKVSLIDLASGTRVRTLSQGISRTAFSPDSKTLAILDKLSVWHGESYESRIKLFNVEDGKELKQFATGILSHFLYSPSGKFIATKDENGSLRIWDVETGKLSREFTDAGKYSTLLAFAPGENAVFYSEERTLKVWNFQTGSQNVGEFDDDTLVFSKDGKWAVVARGYTNSLVLVELATGVRLMLNRDDEATTVKLLSLIPEYYWNNPHVVVSSDGQWQLIPTADGRIRFRDLLKRDDVADLTTLGDDNWVVNAPDGRFDASEGAQKWMHFVIGVEPVDFEQVKDRYYEPGLLEKILKHQPMRKVEPFTASELYPAVRFEPLKSGKKTLVVRLRNRGGGIGPLHVFVNDKIFIDDARPGNFDPNQKEATLTIDLSKAAFVSGQENKIEVFARNRAGWLRSRGSEVYVPAEGEKTHAPPELYAIIGGVADYPENTLDLQFSAKDAEDFARALEIGATKVFGKNKVHIRLLSSDALDHQFVLSGTDSKQLAATKDNFKRVFEEFRKAKSSDILIVYLSGHGTSIKLAGDAGDTYLYLTQDAVTTEQMRLLDEKLRRDTTVSSIELVEWVKNISAKKQAMILDTCAAGAAENSLITRKEITTEQTYQIRAIDRLKSLTGFYVLMGSAANAQSYEATRYGQGLLTYALLQGMKGAGLENEYAYVDKMFNHAVRSVPDLAKGNGRIQEPKIFTPEQSQDFFVGRFTSEEQRLFTLKKVKPVILRPNLQNETVPNDTLRLTPLLIKALSNASTVTSRGRDEAPIVFVDAAEMYDAIVPGGRYRIEGDIVKLSLVLFKNNEVLGQPIEVTGTTPDKDSLVQAIVKAITEAAAKP